MKAQLFSSNFPIHHHHTPSQSSPNFPTFLRPSSSIPCFPPRASNHIPPPPTLLEAAPPEVSAEDGRLLVRRPVMESEDDNDDDDDDDEDEDEEEEEEEESVGRTTIDARLTEIARRIPTFEPKRGEDTGGKEEEKQVVNMDLTLYKAKVLGRRYEFEEGFSWRMT